MASLSHQFQGRMRQAVQLRFRWPLVLLPVGESEADWYEDTDLFSLYSRGLKSQIFTRVITYVLSRLFSPLFFLFLYVSLDAHPGTPVTAIDMNYLPFQFHISAQHPHPPSQRGTTDLSRLILRSTMGLMFPVVRNGLVAMSEESSIYLSLPLPP